MLDTGCDVDADRRGASKCLANARRAEAPRVHDGDLPGDGRNEVWIGSTTGAARMWPARRVEQDALGAGREERRCVGGDPCAGRLAGIVGVGGIGGGRQVEDLPGRSVELPDERNRLVAVDANVLFDLARELDEIVEAFAVIRERLRGTRFLIPLPLFSSSRAGHSFSVSPGIEERRDFRQFGLQVLHLAGTRRSGFSGFVALLFGASQQYLQRLEGGAHLPV